MLLQSLEQGDPTPLVRSLKFAYSTCFETELSPQNNSYIFIPYIHEPELVVPEPVPSCQTQISGPRRQTRDRRCSHGDDDDDGDDDGQVEAEGEVVTCHHDGGKFRKVSTEL